MHGRQSEAAIPPEADAHSIAAALIVREKILDCAGAQPLAALFDAVLGALTGRESLQ